MVLVARAGALAAAFRTHLPELTQRLDGITALDPADRAVFLADAYADIAPADFSRDVLTHARNVRLQIWPPGLGWTDLGVPERLDEWLSRRNRGFTAHRRSHVA
jgi:hypothetical protein